jgi:tRNA(Met) cytidine acetyltransferase
MDCFFNIKISMPANDINRWMSALLAQLEFSRQRQLVALQGPQSWCDEQFNKLFRVDASMQLVSNRKLNATAVPFSKADTCLGGEARLVVLDLFDGFNADVLCIVAGLVQAGGVLLLLSPTVKDWNLRTDRYGCWQDQKSSLQARFVEYFFSSLEQDRETGILVTPDFDFSAIDSLPELKALHKTQLEQGQSNGQAHCLQRIEQWVQSGQNGVALINAERGRGKSTCLGLLVKRLQTRCRILISANSKQTCAQLLQLVPDAEFVAPDRLMQKRLEADLLVIDEAAMIPLPMLHQLARLYPRLVMATTNGGYEGTGQGFMLRFVTALDSKKLMQLSLDKPVRWCQGDQLEAWLNRTLMLKSDRLDPPPAMDPGACEMQLLKDPGDPDNFSLLRQVYALLNAAHYRTRPSDLRMMMENPDLLLIAAFQQGVVVGAALLNIEGGLDDDLCREIFLGRRRPRGHLLAQMLTAQAGLKNFAGYRGIRVQRIAVAETHRRRGFGTRLLEFALRYGQENSLDYLGASFALDPETLCFWQQACFSLVHVSYAQGKSSGDQSIVVLRSITPEIDAEIDLLQQRIQRQLPTWMTQFLQYMSADQVSSLLRFADFRTSIDELEQQEIEAFARGNRGFELCFASLQKWVMQRVARSSDESDSLLIEKAIQNRSWDLLERESGAEGRKTLQQRLRRQVDALLKDC